MNRRAGLAVGWLALLVLGSCAHGGAGDDGAARSAAGSSAPAMDAAGTSGGPGAAASGTAGDFANASEPPPPTGSLLGDAGLMGCNDLQVRFEPVIPTVLLLVDRSGSMWDSGYGSSPTRWQAVYDGLMDPGMGVVQAFASEVRFGLMTYTSDGSGGSCPILEQVAPALDNHAAIDALYRSESERPAFKAETPTGAGVRAATALLQQAGEPQASSAPKYVVLITDGEPDSCTTFDPQCGQDESIAAVQAAFAAGISTYVIGISSDVGAAHLQDVANAGAGLPVRAPDEQFTNNCVNPGYATLSADYATAGQSAGAAPVYQPADGAAIGAALRTLIRGVHGCSFTLEGEVDLEQAHLGTVLLDDDAIVYEQGWTMRDARTLELIGDACARLQSDATQLAISFPCDVIDVL